MHFSAQSCNAFPQFSFCALKYCRALLFLEQPKIQSRSAYWPQFCSSDICCYKEHFSFSAFIQTLLNGKYYLPFPLSTRADEDNGASKWHKESIKCVTPINLSFFRALTFSSITVTGTILWSLMWCHSCFRDVLLQLSFSSEPTRLQFQKVSHQSCFSQDM